MILYKCYNEIKYVEDILEKKEIREYKRDELVLIAIYYRDHINMTPKKREEALYSFCEQYYAGYNIVKHWENIDAALNKARNKQYKLFCADCLPVYSDEVDQINSYDLDYNHKKLMFTLLVYKRLEKIYNASKCLGYNKINYNSSIGLDRKILKVSKISGGNKYTVGDILSDITKLGYIADLPNYKIKLNYLNDCSQQHEKIFDITDFDNIGYYYDYYCGANNINVCWQCGKFYKKTKNNNIRCKDCAPDLKVPEVIIACEDCDQEFIASSLASAKTRCEGCYQIYRRKYKTSKQREYDSR